MMRHHVQWHQRYDSCEHRFDLKRVGCPLVIGRQCHHEPLAWNPDDANVRTCLSAHAFNFTSTLCIAVMPPSDSEESDQEEGQAGASAAAVAGAAKAVAAPHGGDHGEEEGEEEDDDDGLPPLQQNTNRKV